MPLPVTDLFKILSVFGNVLFVLYQLVVHLLDQERSLVAKLWQVHDCIFYQVETVNLILYTHIKWCSDDNRYLEGNEITEEDKRLYDILIRFDAVYYFKQRLNRKALRDYDNLWNYAKELYSIPEYKEFADFEKIKQEELLGTKEENPYQIVGLGPDESYWNEPNNRAEKFA